MRLIDADAYIQEINNRIEAAIKWGTNAIDEEIKTRAEQAIATFCEASLTAKKMPTIEAEPIRHGEWIRKTDTRFGPKLNDIIICSECKIAFSTENMLRRSYCPNCGALMDKEKT